MHTIIQRVKDFDVTGMGEAPAWSGVEWLAMAPVGGSSNYRTRAKVLYSDNGLYFLVDNDDARLSCSALQDFDDLFAEDVVEVFLWPDQAHPVYFEYEISPLNAELPILVSNNGAGFYGWLPWHYQDGRRTRHATTVRGGAQAPMATVEGWTTEFFIPFQLLSGVGNVPARPGSLWRANIYRIDYDAAQPAQWAWCPDTGTNFHNYQRFGVFEFGE